MRRRDLADETDCKYTEEKNGNRKNLDRTKKMNTRRLKIGFVFIIIIGILIYIYLQFMARKQGTLKFPLPPELQEIYDKHGEGEAKPRRRPDLNENVDIMKNTKQNGKDERDSLPDARKEEGKTNEKSALEKKKPVLDNNLHVAIVACGDRAPEALISLKSFAMFSKRHLHFHIFAEEKLHNEFTDKIEKWPKFINGKIKFDIQPISFPGSNDFDQWKSLFKPCASQRLFLPLLLTNVDSVIYVDTDILFLKPPEDLWDMFNKFNDSQLAGLAPEAEIDAIGWYNRFARHPYYGKLGVNSGVMLMNLTRMRNAKWNDDVIPIYKRYKYEITWGDQCILNIMFHFKPEQLYIFPCEWNYRPDHCMYGNNCETALEQGIKVVHGSRRVFHNAKQPEFKVVYDAFEQFDFQTDTIKDLRNKIDTNLEKFKATYCGENRHLFTQVLSTM